MTHTKINHLESKNMKICLIVDDYMPDSIKVAAKMMHELAIEFQKNGHTVTVITPNPKLNTNLDISTLDGIKIYRFKSGEIKNVSKIKRAINETLLSFNAWRICKNILKNDHHDLIIYYSPSIFFGPLVYKLKKLWNAKTYLILRDFFPQWAIDNKILSKYSIITYFFKFFERINYSVADRIGVMTPKNLNWFKKYYKTNKPLEVLYNWADLKKINSKGNIYRKRLGIDDKIVFFYGGNLGQAQDMMNIVRLAIKMRSKKNVHFVLVGAGDEYSLIEKTLLANSINNISLLPSVSQDEYKQMLCEFDVGLFSLNRNHNTHNFPGKLLGYMVQELPILGSINPNNDLKDIIDSYSAGYISINGEDELFFQNALKLLDKDKRVEIGTNANKLLKENFSVSSAVKQIIGNSCQTQLTDSLSN